MRKKIITVAVALTLSAVSASAAAWGSGPSMGCGNQERSAQRDHRSDYNARRRAAYERFREASRAYEIPAFGGDYPSFDHPGFAGPSVDYPAAPFDFGVAQQPEAVQQAIAEQRALAQQQAEAWQQAMAQQQAQIQQQAEAARQVYVAQQAAAQEQAQSYAEQQAAVHANALEQAEAWHQAMAKQQAALQQQMQAYAEQVTQLPLQPAGFRPEVAYADPFAMPFPDAIADETGNPFGDSPIGPMDMANSPFGEQVPGCASQRSEELRARHEELRKQREEQRQARIEEQKQRRAAIIERNNHREI
jgi:hypothetical protein